ncbi:MAG: two-component system, OmpR family, sensor kinase [Gaiellaceae bacterium]|jgi:signal transduction histidine kinase|nr:two-component system, OmpR family, sensor kinase [Gaiellaceae bacterium]MEA2282427.1 two-component system, OmpR family, sensor kinase [Solirubrobacteraceae bacterium]
MPATGSRRRLDRLEVAWVAFALLNVGVMLASPSWETIPFHLIWFSLTVLYGFRVWALKPTYVVLAVQGLVTGGLIANDARHGTQEWGELFEVPLMSAMFLAMVWHARRHRAAAQALARHAEERGAFLARQERFLHDASHELRTPITIARGHLEVMQRRSDGRGDLGVEVAIDELARMERIVERLLILARAGESSLAGSVEEVDLDALIEDVALRWAGVAPRAWRVGHLSGGMIRTDQDALRIALDALVENAVAHTQETDAIELRAHWSRGDVAIEVVDEGCGIPREALEKIFERFARVDASRARGREGVGLGLAIVDAIAKAHGGRCTVKSSPDGSAFTLLLPGFRCASDAGIRGDGGIASAAPDPSLEPDEVPQP